MTDVASPVALLAAVTGLVVALPIAATAHEVAATGPVRPLLRWWSSTTPKAVSITCAVATAGIAFAVCLRIGCRISMPGYWLFSVLGVGLVYVDLRRRRLPHIVIGAIWATCATLFTAESVYRHQVANLTEAAVSGLTVSAALMIIALAVPGQLGLGDVHFAGAVAFTLGWLQWETAAAAIVMALVLQWFWTMIAVARTRDRIVTLPLGPALFGAWVVTIAIA